jgi:hypothetical protein
MEAQAGTGIHSGFPAFVVSGKGPIANYIDFGFSGCGEILLVRFSAEVVIEGERREYWGIIFFETPE